MVVCGVFSFLLYFSFGENYLIGVLSIYRGRERWGSVLEGGFSFFDRLFLVGIGVFFCFGFVFVLGVIN